MKHIRLTIPLLIAFLAGLLGLGIQYAPGTQAAQLKADVSNWLMVIGTIAMLLGVYSMFHLHWMKMKRRTEGWGYSLFFFFGFLATIGAAAYNGGLGFWRAQQQNTFYNWIYNNIYEPSGATMFSMLGFYIASAAYRTFRARSYEATLLLGAAIIVMLGRTALGEMIHRVIPTVTEWLMQIPNTAAKRGVLLGASLGVIATSLKIIFGIERTYLGGGD